MPRHQFVFDSSESYTNGGLSDEPVSDVSISARVKYRKPAVQADRLVCLPRPRYEELEDHGQACALLRDPVEGAIRLRHVKLETLGEVLHAHLHGLGIASQDRPLGPGLRAQAPVLRGSLSSLPEDQQLPELCAQGDQSGRDLQVQVSVLADGDVQHIPDVPHPVHEALQLVQVVNLDERLGERLSRVERRLELRDLSPRHRLRDRHVLDDRGFVALRLEGEEGQRQGAVRRQLLHQLYLEPLGVRSSGGVGGGGELVADADAAADGAVEEGEVDGEGDAVVVLAGDAVAVEEGLDTELRDGLEAVAVEEVVEEDGVVPGEVEVARPVDLLQRRQEPLLEEGHAVVREKRLELHRRRRRLGAAG